MHECWSADRQGALLQGQHGNLSSFEAARQLDFMNLHVDLKIRSRVHQPGHYLKAGGMQGNLAPPLILPELLLEQALHSAAGKPSQPAEHCSYCVPAVELAPKVDTAQAARILSPNSAFLACGMCDRYTSFSTA